MKKSRSKTERASNIDNAIARSKKYYDLCCTVSGERKGTDGCHIYPRDTHPHFADLDDNILPGDHGFHLALDKLTDMDERLQFIEKNIHRDEDDWIYDKWKAQRERLSKIVRDFRKENGGQDRWKHGKFRG